MSVWGESCEIWKDPRYFSSWCPPRSLQGRATCRLWAAEWEKSSSGDQHAALLVQQRQPCKGTASSETQTTYRTTGCLLPADGSCGKTILLELGLLRVSNVSSSFSLFFCLAVLKNEQGLFLLHRHLLRAGSSLSLCLRKAVTEDFILPVHME